MKNKMRNRMKGMKNTRFLWLLLALFCGIPAEAGTISGDESAGTVGELVAFPGAEGFGRNATGGRGGRVYHVTTLEDGFQEGTLRHALSQKGARTVVFDVAGTIFLNTPLRITNGDLTIAGQSAPGQGICIARCPLTINADNVIVRYLRFRVGNESGGEPDGLGSTDCRNVIVDHCSISWSVDECCSVYGGENLTVQWCLVSESLRTAGHAKGRHGYGAIWGGAKASFHHNLLAHHESRFPRLGPRPFTQEREHVDMRNNVFYNWAGNGCYGGEAMHVNIVNNYYKPGPATPKNSPVRYRIAAVGVRTTQYCTKADGTPNVWKPMEHVWGTFYVDGNVVEGSPEVTKDNWTKGIYEQINNAYCDNTFTEEVRKEMRLSEPLDAGVVTTHTANQAYKLVLEHAGCSKQRDSIDERIIKETRKGTATYIGSVTKGAEKVPGLIDLPADVKPAGAASPWPELSDGGVTAAEIRDTDGDGMPDVWETAHGLDPEDASDGIATTLSKEGYTNLEVYLNGLVAPPYQAVVAQDGSGDYTSVQDAVDAAPDNCREPWLIFVKNGSYREQVVVPSTKTYIHLIGQDKNKTIIHHKLNVGGKPEEGTESSKTAFWKHSVHNPASEVHQFEGSVVYVKGAHFYTENISYINDWGVDHQNGPQALAMSSQADCASFNNCILRSFQDTWMTSRTDSHRLYVKDCWIEGAVDYFYGSGDALLEDCTLYNVRSGSVIVAPSHKDVRFGYVFRNCIVDGNAQAADGRQKLGRPWHNSPRAVYIHTTMRIPLAPEGWTNMGAIPALFAEYDSRDAEGNVLDLSRRKTEYDGRGPNNPPKGSCRATITRKEAEGYVYERIIPGNDGWDPRAMMVKLPAPRELKRQGLKLSWKKVAAAIGYVIFDNDEVVGFAKEPVFSLASDVKGILKICAVNRYGSLGTESTF